MYSLRKIFNDFNRYNLIVANICAVLLVSGCTRNDSNSLTSVENASATLNESQSGNLAIVDVLPAPENTRNGADQLISANDILEIDVFQVDQLDKTVQVDSNGRFSMPLIGAVQAAGKTVSAIESDLEVRYGANYLQSPDITVFVKESAGQKMTLDGEFVKPGVYNTGSTTTLLQAVALASGLTPLSDEKKIFVFRSFGDKKLTKNYNIRDIRAGKISDPRIYGGDVIVAFTSDTKIAARNLREALGAAVNVTRVVTPF